MKRVKLLLLFVAMLFTTSSLFAENAILYMTKASFKDLRADQPPVPMTVSYANGKFMISYDQTLVGSQFTISTVEGETLYSGQPQVVNGYFVIPVTFNSSDMYLLMIDNAEEQLVTAFTLGDL